MHSESQWRYRASRRGLRLVKYKRDTSAYEQFGPYALFEQATNKIAALRLDAEAVERALFPGDANHGR